MILTPCRTSALLLLGLACQANVPAGWSFAPAPSAPPLEPATRQRLAAAWQSRPVSYTPEAAQHQANGLPRYLNRLFLSGSAYLQQHAHNPVDWRPWGPEALAEAKRLQRPILLSVGYATCHWCHVMAHESFEDEEIASAINANFIAIKVDREELPDVDAMAAAALHSLGLSGGWPTTLWLTPDGKPFVGGTYYPPRDSAVGPGLLTLLHTIAAAAQQDPQRLQAEAGKLLQAMQARPPPAAGSVDMPGLLQQSTAAIRRAYDPLHGGLRGPRKFPAALPARFLLRQARRNGDAAALTMVGQTLQHMAAGGLQDALGGGFHRYTVDAQWQVPHFEKMLYDNALLLTVYLEAYQASGADDFAAVARATISALLRDFESPAGGFYAGTDADSLDAQGVLHEGAYYSWSAAELTQVLGPQAAAAHRLFNIVDPGPLAAGRSVLTTEIGAPQDANAQALRARLLAARGKRPPPRLDDLQVTAWNGLTLDALATAARVLQDANALAAARRTGNFILGHLRPSGHLLHSLRQGAPGPAAYFDDSAAVITGMLSLYESTGELRWLQAAVDLDAESWNTWADGTRSTPRPGLEALPAPEAEGDVPVPAAISLQALNLQRLQALTETPAYAQRAAQLTERLALQVARNPLAWPSALVALDWAVHDAKQICLVAAHDRAELQSFVQAMRRVLVPAQVVNLALENDTAAQARVPALQGKVALDGKATAYVCEHHLCALPTQDPNALLEQLR